MLLFFEVVAAADLNFAHFRLTGALKSVLLDILKFLEMETA